MVNLTSHVVKFTKTRVKWQIGAVCNNYRHKICVGEREGERESTGEVSTPHLIERVP